MTETEQQPTAQPEKTQSFHHHVEEEISLVDLLEVLLRKKVLILAITSVCALISVIYAQSISPTYEATISFLEPQETFLSVLPPEIAKNLPGGRGISEDDDKPKGEKPKDESSAFAMFLSQVTSYKLKKEVFESGNFLTKFVGDVNVANVDNIVLGIHNSTSITKKKADENLPIFDMPIYLQLKGSNPEAMAEFLTALAESAKQNVAKEIGDNVRLIIKTKIDTTSREISDSRQKIEIERENDIRVFSEALAIAKNLGVKNNNFDQLNNDKFSVFLEDQKAAREDQKAARMEIQNNSLPKWFLYGEKALQQEILSLKSRKNEVDARKLVRKEIMLKKYQNIDLSPLKVKVAIIAQPSIPPTTPIKPNKLLIIAMGIALGLFIGLVMAFLSNSMDQLEKKQISSTSE